MKKILNDPFSQELTLKIDSPNFSIDKTYDIEYYDYDFDQNILINAELYYKSLDQIYPVLTKYNPSYIELESYEYDKQSPYPVKYELLYKSFNRYITIKEIVSDNGKARFSNLIPGYIYYVKAIDLSNRYNSKIVKFIPKDYDPEAQPEILTTYFGNSWDNFKYNFITSNVFGEKTIYLENNKPHIKLKQIDNKRYEISLLEIKNKADEFDLVLEDHRTDKIIKITKRIYINDGFSTPYNISIYFTDSNAVIFKWSTEGIYEFNKFYISDNITNKGTPVDVIGTSTYIITNYDNNKTQYLWLSSIRDGKEKISDPITIDAFDKSINPLVAPSVNYSINQNNDLLVYLNHNSTTVDNYSVYLEENEITSIDGLTPIATSTSKSIVIPNFDVYNNYDRTLKLLATTNKYNHSYLSENKDLYVAYDWTPENLTNPSKLWLSAESAAKDSSNRVSQMQDISGNKYHADQTTNTNKPLFVSQEVRFDGVDDYLTISSSANNLFRSVNKAWVFAVFKRDQVDYNQRPLINFSNNATSARVSFNVGSTENQIYFGGRRLDSDSYGRATHEEPIIAGKYYICLGYIDYSANTIELWVDGALSDKNINSFPSSGNTSDTASSTIRIGANAGIVPTVFFNGDLSFTMVGNTQLSTEERQKLEGWAAHKYGLTDNLPVDHPYKNRKPVIDHTPTNLTAEFKDD